MKKEHEMYFINIPKIITASTISAALLSIGMIQPNHIVKASDIKPIKCDAKKQTVNDIIVGGSASIDNDLITLTPDQKFQAGSAYISTPIDFSKNILLDLKVSTGKKSQKNGGGDGIAISFVPCNQIHLLNRTNGGSLAVGGIKSIFGFKLDTYFNGEGEDGVIDPDPNIQKEESAFGAFFFSDDEGSMKTISDSAQKIDTDDTNSFQNLIFSYDSQQHLLKINYKGKTWVREYYNSSSVPVYLVLSAATGQNHNIQQIKINKKDINTDPSKISVNYLDENNHKIAASETIVGCINEQYKTKEKQIDGYELIESPKNKSGFFTNHNSDVNYRYKKMQHQIVIDYIYNNRLLRKEILSGLTGETINHSNQITLSGLKLYSVIHSEWSGEFVIPNSNQESWTFVVALSKNVTPDNPNRDLVNRDSGNYSPQNHSKLVEKKEHLKRDSVIINDKKVTYLDYHVEITQQERKNIYSDWPFVKNSDSVYFYEHNINSSIKPSPFSQRTSSFTSVLITMAAYTTFTNR